MKEYRSTINSKQRGAILLLAMVFLVLLAMLATTATQTTALEFRMAGNDQFREEAFQTTEGVSTALVDNVDNFPVVGDVGYTICLNSAATSGCSADLVAVGANITAVPTGASLDFSARRQGPRLLGSLPFRQSQNNASSSAAYDVAIFETNVEVAGGAVGVGSAHVAQGVALVIVNSSQ